MSNSMRAVLSLLDEAHTAKVVELWDALEQRFGVRQVRLNPFPHVSYHVAKRYDWPALEAACRTLAAGWTPLTIEVIGVHVLTGPKPLLFLPVVRSAELSRRQEAVWRALAGCSEPVSHYSPERWLPHIGVAHGDLTAAQLPEVIAFLNQREWVWSVRLDNLSVVSTVGDTQALTLRLPLGA